MIDLTDEIDHWVRCSSDVYQRWFSSFEEGGHDFLPVEEALFDFFVIDKCGFAGETSYEFSQSCKVLFEKGLSADRMVCADGKGGSVGKAEFVELGENTCLPVHHFCPVTDGRLGDGVAYIEVKLDRRRSLLEPFDGLGKNFRIVRPVDSPSVQP